MKMIIVFTLATTEKFIEVQFGNIRKNTSEYELRSCSCRTARAGGGEELVLGTKMAE